MINFLCKKKEIKLENVEVVIYDLSVGYISSVEDGSTKETFENILLDASNLSKDEISKLRQSEAEYLSKEIIELTYGSTKNNGDEGDSKK